MTNAPRDYERRRPPETFFFFRVTPALSLLRRYYDFAALT